MMTILSFFIWSANPDIFIIPGLDHPVRWYGFLFALGFIISQQVVMWIYRSDGRNDKDVDQLTMYMVIATVIGARLGHCLFYNPSFYLSNPLEILKIWEGGLASHGGALGIFLALYMYSRTKSDQSYMWVLDRIAIVTLMTGSLIRMGNFMNSEIIGLPTNSGYGVVFARGAEDVLMNSFIGIDDVNFESGGEAMSNEPGTRPMIISIKMERGQDISEDQAVSLIGRDIRNKLIRHSLINPHIYQDPQQALNYKLYKKGGIQYVDIHTLGVPRHPAQLYESIYCFVLFLLLLYIWYYHRNKINEGFLFGLFMFGLWTLRFIDEFFKENQESWEADIPLNMGQWLSIPLALVGLFILIRAIVMKKESKTE